METGTQFLLASLFLNVGGGGMIQGKSNKINNNSPNTNLDTPSIKCLEKLLTFGIGSKVNTNTEPSHFVSFLWAVN